MNVRPEQKFEGHLTISSHEVMEVLDRLIDKRDRTTNDREASRKPYSGSFDNSGFKIRRRSRSPKVGIYTSTGFSPWITGSILPDENGCGVQIKVTTSLMLQIFQSAVLAFLLFMFFQILFAMLLQPLTIAAAAVSIVIAYPLEIVFFRMGAKSDVRSLLQALQRRQKEPTVTA